VLANLGVPNPAFYAIPQTAQNRGWVKDQPVLLEHVEDAPRSGRPLKAVDTIQQMIVDIIERNSTTRQYSTVQIAMVLEDSFRREGIKICRRTILQTLKRLKYKSVKLTTKPGLNNDQKKVRLRWALKYQSWTIEHWKKAAWS